MRWSQGVWSEERFTDAVDATKEFCVYPYGPSGVAPDHDVRAYELYFERLEEAGLGNIKRPDLLVFRKSDRAAIEEILKELGGAEELPFRKEDDSLMVSLLSHALVAIECENSLWKAKSMPSYGEDMKAMRRLGGKLGMKKNAVLPTVILKDEDLDRLLGWESSAGVPIHIWHSFYDMAYGIELKTAKRLIQDGDIEPTTQTFQAPGGATSSKTIYKIYYHHAYELGVAQEEPSLDAKVIVDKNGHILPYVSFSGGTLELTETAIKVLEGLSN